MSVNLHQIEPDTAPSRTLGQYHPAVDDMRTTGNGWYITCKKYNTGDAATVAIKLTSEDSLKRGGGSKRKSTTRDEMDSATLKKSQTRTKKTVRDLVLQLNADRLMTLTYQDNKEDLKACWYDFKRFNQRMKKRYSNWQYVAVPEIQKRGAVHFHLAVNGYYHANTVRKLWREVVGKGNIDITPPRHLKYKVQQTTVGKMIAGYISKYLTKSDITAFNAKRYGASKNIEPPIKLDGWLALGESAGYSVERVMSQLIYKITRRNNLNQWEYEGYFHVFGCST